MEITAVDTTRLGEGTGLVRVETDEDITGYGEPVVETAPGATLDVVETIAERYLLGADPVPIEKHRRKIQDAVWFAGGPVFNSALGGLEHALWDIKGKDLGVPVYELLGGPVRDRVRVYKYIGTDYNFDEWSREKLVSQAKTRLDEGLDAMKFNPQPESHTPYPQCVDEVKETVRVVRDTVGPDVDIMVDPASRWHLPEAKHILSELEEFNPLFAEDFIGVAGHLDPNEYEKLAESTHVPLAIGDRLYHLGQFEEFLQRNAVAVVQPNISHACGILEIKKIAAAAEHHGIRIAPQNALGPVATAAAVHVDLTVPNLLIQEVAGTDFFGAWDSEHIDTTDIEITDGHIAAPEHPGLGVEVSDALFDENETHEPPPMYFDSANLHVPDWSPRTDHGREFEPE